MSVCGNCNGPMIHGPVKERVLHPTTGTVVAVVDVERRHCPDCLARRQKADKASSDPES